MGGDFPPFFIMKFKFFLLIFILFFSLCFPCFAYENIDFDGFVAVTNYHYSGELQLFIYNGIGPYSIYRSLDNSSWEFQSSISDDNLPWIQYGLDNGTTYYYMIRDSAGHETSTTYTTPLIVSEFLPLRVTDITDNTIHLLWSHLDFPETIYLDGDVYDSDITANEYTIYDLEPDTEYMIYLVDSAGYRSNTVIVKTTDNFSKLESILNKLFINEYVDSNGNGVRDEVEEITDKFDEILDKFVGDTYSDLNNFINGIHDDFNSEYDLPVFSFDWFGSEYVILDLNDSFFIDIISDIRKLLLAILTVTFVISFLNLFNVHFKV